MRRTTNIAIAALFLALGLVLTACDPGSKDYTQGFYTVNFAISQRSDGAVLVTGTTDLPQNTKIEVVVASTPNPALAQQMAVLSGTTRSVGAHTVDRNGHFVAIAEQALTNTCHQLPPCGPFPAGTYWILVDAETPHGSGTDPEVTTYQDPRFLSATHGFVGFPGLEFVRKENLRAINERVDKNGNQVAAPGSASGS